jgi:hypothetical protein
MASRKFDANAASNFGTLCVEGEYPSRKEIALALGKDPDAPFLFRMLGGGNALALVRDHVLRECQSATRLDAARRLFGVRWIRPSFSEG